MNITYWKLAVHILTKTEQGFLSYGQILSGLERTRTRRELLCPMILLHTLFIYHRKQLGKKYEYTCNSTANQNNSLATNKAAWI